MDLCEFAKDESSAIYKVMRCTLNNEVCGFYRYCTNERCVKMTPYFYRYGCKLRNEKLKGEQHGR